MSPAKKWLLIIAGGLFVLGCIYSMISGLFEPKGVTEIRGLLKKAEEKTEKSIADIDVKLKGNEKAIEAAGEQAQAASVKASQAGARAQAAAAQVSAVRPAQTDQELKERYEKLGYHPAFR